MSLLLVATQLAALPAPAFAQDVAIPRPAAAVTSGETG